jgi:prophage antirepressor-like protein
VNDLQIFNNPEFGEIRVVEIDNEPWFIVADICRALDIGNPSQAITRLDDDEITLISNDGKNNKINAVSEAGLYALALGSRKPDAKKFKRWITHEVLPAIRKTGTYIVPSTPQMTPLEIMRTMIDSQIETEKRVLAVEETTRAIEKKLDSALQVFSAPNPDHWKTDIDTAVNYLAESMHWSIIKFRGKLYSELESTANVALQARVNRLRERMKKQGHTYREAQAASKLDAISKDKQLRAIFEGIVRRYQAQYSIQN